MDMETSLSTWQDDCISLVHLPTDYANGGYKKPTLQQMRKGAIIQDPALLIESKDSRLSLAHKARYSDFAVYKYGDILRNKSKAKELYRITREDYQEYLRDAAEQDILNDDRFLASQ